MLVVTVRTNANDGAVEGLATEEFSKNKTLLLVYELSDGRLVRQPDETLPRLRGAILDGSAQTHRPEDIRHRIVVLAHFHAIRSEYGGQSEVPTSIGLRWDGEAARS